MINFILLMLCFGLLCIPSYYIGRYIGKKMNSYCYSDGFAEYTTIGMSILTVLIYVAVLITNLFK